MSVNDVEERRPESRAGNADFPGFSGKAAESDNRSFTEAVYKASDEEKPPAVDDILVRSPEAVSWTAFNTVVSALLSLGIAAVGGGFACVHSDLSDIRTDIPDIRTDIRDSRADTRDMRADVRDMRSAVGGLQADTLDAQASMRDMQTGMRDIRGSVASIDGRVQETRDDMLKAIAVLEKQSTLTNAKLDDLAAAGRQGR